MSPQVIHGYRVSPGNISDLNSNGRSQTLALSRTGCVITASNRLDELGIQAGCSDQLVEANAFFLHVSGQGLHVLQILSREFPS